MKRGTVEYSKKLSEAVKKGMSQMTLAQKQQKIERCRKTVKERFAKGEWISPIKGKKMTKEVLLKISKMRKDWHAAHPEWKVSHSLKMSGRTREYDVVKQCADKMVGRPQTAPLTKKGPTNHKSQSYILKSPEGEIFCIKNLLHFVRENPELFSLEDSRWKPHNVRKKIHTTVVYSCNASKGLYKIFQKGPTQSWKGWTPVKKGKL